MNDTRAALEAALPAELGSPAALSEYFDWLFARQPAGLNAEDDVILRDFLLDQRTRGVDRPTLQRTLAALKRLYTWAATTGRLSANPFDDFNFDRPWLSRDQIRRREQARGDPQQRELSRLRALNRLAEALHRAPDVPTTLASALAAVTEVMGLTTGWAFLLAGQAAPHAGLPARQPHDFALAAACGLPPGLEQQGCYYLTRPPDCHCQSLLREGRMARAVNVVECTRLQDATTNTRGLLFHATVPLIIQGRPIGLLNYATDEWQFLTGPDLQLLSAVGAHVSLALERARLYEQAEAQRARFERELTLAREVQATLLPDSLPNLPGFALAADWRAAHEVAGDFYDILPLPNDRWGLVIADVADKGAPAALYMAVAHSRLRAAAEHAASPAALLLEVNEVLYRQASTGMFVTLFYAVLEPATRTLTFCNAGHNPPLLRRADGTVTALPRGGTPLGVLAAPRLVDRSRVMEAGEALVAYTDGVTEALSPSGEEFGTGRLSVCLAAAPPDPAGLLQAVTTALAAFIDGAPQPDDITIVIVGCSS